MTANGGFCEILDGETERPFCAARATHEAVGMCVHEHLLDEAFLCATHAGWLEQEPWNCGRCREVDDHKCVLRWEVRELAVG